MDIAIYLILYAMQNTTSYRSFRRITYKRSLSPSFHQRES